MKRYCKKVDITNENFIRQCAQKALKGKWKRNDVLRYCGQLLQCSAREEVETPIGRSVLLDKITEQIRHELLNHKLHVPKIFYRQRVDASSFKVRNIGIENIKQQIYDYIAVEAIQDLLKRVGEFQCASIKKRGIRYGVQYVQRWVRQPSARYFVQLDIKQCFPSIPHDKILAFLHKYIANDEVYWLIETLITSFDSGLVIGSYLSQHLCNLYLSQLYHEIKENMFYTKRNAKMPQVQHVLFYMDDILLIGSNKTQLRHAVKHIIDFAASKLGLTIKPTWQIHPLDGTHFIDMMGYRIYPTHTTLRRRVFLRARRAFKGKYRKKLTYEQAQKCVSYYGYFVHTDLYHFTHKYKIPSIIYKARRVISNASTILNGSAASAAS